MISVEYYVQQLNIPRSPRSGNSRQSAALPLNGYGFYCLIQDCTEGLYENQKDGRLSIRFRPNEFLLLEKFAALENRSLSSTIKMLIRCEATRHGVIVPDIMPVENALLTEASDA